MKDISVDEDISSLGESMKKSRVEQLRINENIHDITGICVYVFFNAITRIHVHASTFQLIIFTWALICFFEEATECLTFFPTIDGLGGTISVFESPSRHVA